jgi:hypothetical protein
MQGMVIGGHRRKARQEDHMGTRQENDQKGEVLAMPRTEGGLTVQPPNTGFVGKFLDDVQNMFRARAMRMKGLLGRINESGQRTEALLRMAAEKMEEAEARLEDDLRKQGLGSDSH